MTDPLILCYHAVSPNWTAPLSVTPSALERQLTLLVRRGWRGATFTEAVLAPKSKRTLVVTFDDAFASVRDLAEPILSSLGLTATVFAPTAFMSHRQPLIWDGIDHWRNTPDALELRSMDWTDLAALVNLGWEVGSHTRTHPRLTRLNEPGLHQELEASREACCAHLGLPCRALAYPYGDVDPRVVQRAREVGYVAGAALSSSLKPLGPLRSPRVGIYHTDTKGRFRLKVNPAVRAWRASGLWPGAR